MINIIWLTDLAILTVELVMIKSSDVLDSHSILACLIIGSYWLFLFRSTYLFLFDNFIFIPRTMSFSKNSGRIKKYPKINYDYESTDYENLYFAGTVAHSLDFRKSSGGFIHGFRYTSRWFWLNFWFENHLALLIDLFKLYLSPSIITNSRAQISRKELVVHKIQLFGFVWLCLKTVERSFRFILIK